MDINTQILAVCDAALQTEDLTRSQHLTSAAHTLILMRNERFPEIPQVETEWANRMLEKLERALC